MHTHFQARPVVFGEVLFDVFDDGREVLGGAPFNVAWHLRGFGLDPLFVGRVGADERGELVRERMSHWNLDASAVQDDLVHATGEVRAHVEGGSPHYEILSDRAWDFVDGDRALAELRLHEVSLLYHGTLALRSPRSRATFERVRAAIDTPILCDVNLREPWTPLARAHESLAGASIAKLNDDELGLLTGQACRDDAPCLDAAHLLRERHGLDLVVVTRGARGAVAISADQQVSVPAEEPPRMVDTVGAGDAFASVFMVGLLEKWPLRVTLRRATRFASAICAIQGATTDDPELHRSHRERWQREEEDPDAV